ncbi:MAG: type II secretion system protein GspC [Deltaproteobacteria bacterium]
MPQGAFVDRTSRFGRFLLVALTAWAGALAVNSGLELWLARQAPPPKVAAARIQKNRTPTARTSTDTSIILARNIFGSQTADGAEVGEAVTAMGLRLRGTAHAGGKGFAVFENIEGKRQDIFEVGQRIFEGPTLVSVTESYVTVKEGGRHLTIELFDKNKDEQTDKAARPPTQAPHSRGIRPTSAGRYLVDRREVDYSIDNLNTILTQARAVPLLKDGRSLGFRLFNIHSGSIFERMGLENGDVVQTVNDVKLSDPSKALALLDSIQTVDSITIDLLRKDKPTTFVYTIK